MYVPRLRAVASVATVLSALVAIFGLVTTLGMLYLNQRASTIQDWQQVVVYGIIDSAAQRGVGFEDIKMKYVTEAVAYPDLDIPKSEISASALRSVLLDLQKAHLVVYAQDNLYRPLRPEFRGDGPFPEQRVFELELMTNKIFGIIRQHENHFSPDELVAQYAKEVGMEPDEFYSAISMILKGKDAVIGEDGKLRTRFAEPAKQ